MHLSTSLVFLSILSWFLIGIEKSQADVFVTTSIRPLQLIAQAIVQDRGSVYAIIDSQDSPHHYSITPSDRINLEAADLLLRISPEFEIFLADSFALQASSKPLITAANIAGISLEYLSDNSIDPHLWLNTENALVIAKRLTAELRRIDAENESDYEAALTLFESELETLNSSIRNRLAQYDKSDYLVYHDAYQYFERQFGLPGGLALVYDPEVQPSMRDLLELRNHLQAKSPSCILLEVDSDVELVNTALENRAIKSEIVDLLGYEIEDGVHSYSQLMLSVTNSFTNCFNHSL